MEEIDEVRSVGNDGMVDRRLCKRSEKRTFTEREMMESSVGKATMRKSCRKGNGEEVAKTMIME